MATGAEGLLNRIIAMSLLKGGLCAVVAAKAKGRFRLHQKFFQIRAVGGVAGGAALLPDLMKHLLLVALFLVALKTRLIPFCFQQSAELRGVRIMALNAFPSLQGGMDIGLVHPDLVFAVARVADFISFFLEDQFRHQTMPEMAILAFFLFDRGMDSLHPHVLVSKFLVTVEATLADKLLPRRRSATERPFLLCRHVTVCKDEAHQQKYSEEDGFISLVKPWHDVSFACTFDP